MKKLRSVLFPGSSEMAGRMRALDWSSTDLGPPSAWPANLRTVVSLCLDAPCPILLWWGPRHSILYNDAAVALLGKSEHSEMLGRPGGEGSGDVWDTIRPMLDGVRASARPTASEDVPLFFARKLPREEVYVTFTFAPILGPDGAAVQGIFNPCTETTERVLGARRLETLHKLSVQASKERTVEATCEVTAQVLRESDLDVAFAAIYLVDDEQTTARRGAVVGAVDAPSPFPHVVSLQPHASEPRDESDPWHLRAVWQGGVALDTENLIDAGLSLPGGRWPEPASRAVVVPVFAPAHDGACALVVLGASPRRPLDDAYRAFFGLVAGHIGAAIAGARAEEAARRLAERPAPMPVGLRRPHVLLAVDNLDLQRDVSRLLGAHYEVEEVGDVDAAMAAARRLVPDLVLSDIITPPLDGLALLRALRDDPCTRGVPVILLSAGAGEGREVEGGAAGFGDYLVKPFGAHELLARVASRLEVARLHRESIERERVLRESSDEAHAMRRLHELSTRLLAIDGVQPVLEAVLDATIALHGADFGMVQLVDAPTADLLIVAQRGVPAECLDDFARVHDEASSFRRAMSSGERVVIEDVTTDSAFAQHGHMAAATGFRAVQSTPLVSHDGDLFGIVSTHFRRPHRFTDSVLRFTDLYVRHAANFIERKRAEMALRSSEERFRRYFDLGLIGMALTSPGQGCLEVNDELCRILGYPREELLGKSWAEMTHPDDLPADLDRFDRVMAGEVDGYSLDKRWLRKDGRVIYSTMTTKCLRAPDGSVDCFVGLVLDITDRLESDDALRRARDQLAHVARVTAMGELVASIAHEMNQPLAALVAHGHAGARWLAARPPNLPEAVAAIERIVDDAHRASQVIARIRGFLGRGEMRRGVVHMHEVLRDVAAIIQSEARARSVKVRIAPRVPSLPSVIGDRVQLQQVVLNLAMNGIEAMAGVPEAQRCLQMGLERDGPHLVRVSVRDAGIGLDVADRDRIFDAFYSSKPTGMGMGLAISRSLVEAHAGSLWCARNEEGGETFSFTLPT